MFITAVKSSPPVPNLSQLDPVHTPTSYFLKIQLNIILPSTPGSPKWSLSLSSPHQNPVYASPLPHTRYMPRSSHSSRFYHPNNSGCGVQILLDRNQSNLFPTPQTSVHIINIQYYSPYNRSLLCQVVPVNVLDIRIFYAVCASCICVTHKLLVFLTSLISRSKSFFFSRINFIFVIFVLLYGALQHSVAERLCNDLVAPKVLKLS